MRFGLVLSFGALLRGGANYVGHGSRILFYVLAFPTRAMLRTLGIGVPIHGLKRAIRTAFARVAAEVSEFASRTGLLSRRCGGRGRCCGCDRSDSLGRLRGSRNG